MMASRPEIWLASPSQADLDWLIGQGIAVSAMVKPHPLMIATGEFSADRLFEHADDGQRWLAFEENEDFVFWQPRSGAITTFANRAFALGEGIIANPGTYAFDCALNIFQNPLDWLRAERDGVVVLDWQRAFDKLRDAPRIAIAEQLLPTYRRFMKPDRMPELCVIPERRRMAA